MVAAVDELSGELRFDRMWKVLRHLSAGSIAWVFHAERLNCRLVLLEDASDQAFLTGDQPVVNTVAIERPIGDELEDLEFYYPISLKLAVLLPRRSDCANGARFMIDREQVDRYNRCVVHSSDEQAYADSAEILEQVAARES